MSPTTRKRLEFIALCALGPLGGDMHYHRWPDNGGPFKRTRRSKPRSLKGYWRA